jgi:SAM-dependent methyltransferase
LGIRSRRIGLGHKEAVNAYFETRAITYAQKSRRGPWAWFREKEWRAVVALIKPSREVSVVDLACGAGFYSARLAREYGAKVLGVDFSTAMLDSLSKENIPTLRASIDELTGELAGELKDIGEFDCALIGGALEFIERPENVFSGCRNIVREGGRLVILIPKVGLAGKLYKFSHEWAGCPTQIRSEQTYRRLAEDAGFAWQETITCTPLSLAIRFEKTGSRD